MKRSAASFAGQRHEFFSGSSSPSRRTQAEPAAEGRGEHGWRHARQLRPEALILTEQEALNECGWGYVWRKRADADLWDVVQPSVWPSNKPNSGLDAERFEQRIKIAAVFNEAVSIGAGLRQLIRVAHADQIGHDASAGTFEVRDDIAP